MPKAQAEQTAIEVADEIDEKVPAGQLEHMDEPRVAENVPGGQGLQLALRPDAADAVPRGQGAQNAAAEARAKEPGVQGMQEEAANAPMAEDDVPAGQLMHAVASAFA